MLLKSNLSNRPFINVSISSGLKVVGVPPPIYKVSIDLFCSSNNLATPSTSSSSLATYVGFNLPNCLRELAGNEQ